MVGFGWCGSDGDLKLSIHDLDFGRGVRRRDDGNWVTLAKNSHLPGVSFFVMSLELDLVGSDPVLMTFHKLSDHELRHEWRRSDYYGSITLEAELQLARASGHTVGKLDHDMVASILQLEHAFLKNFGYNTSGSTRLTVNSVVKLVSRPAWWGASTWIRVDNVPKWRNW